MIEIDQTGVLEKEKYPLKVFPNPAQEWMTIQMNQTGRKIESVSLYNTLGVQIFSLNGMSGDQVTLNTGSGPSGLYLLHIRMDNGDVTMHRVEILK